jgi:hypothetical protein
MGREQPHQGNYHYTAALCHPDIFSHNHGRKTLQSPCLEETIAKQQGEWKTQQRMNQGVGPGSFVEFLVRTGVFLISCGFENSFEDGRRYAKSLWWDDLGILGKARHHDVSVRG